jgi:hypothetical protein
MRMRRIILSSVVSLSLSYVSTLPHKQHEFLVKKFIDHKMCFDFLYNACLKNVSL